MITIETEIAAPVDQVWAMWSEPQHIEQWNFAGDDWQMILDSFKGYVEASVA